MKRIFLKSQNKSLPSFWGAVSMFLCTVFFAWTPVQADPILGRTDPPIYPYVYKDLAHGQDGRFSNRSSRSSNSSRSYSYSSSQNSNSNGRQYAGGYGSSNFRAQRRAEASDWYYSQPARRISSAFYTDRAGRVRKMPDLQGAVVTSHLWSYRDPGGNLSYTGDALGAFARSQGLYAFPTHVSGDGTAYNGPSGWMSPATVNKYWNKSSASSWE
ncbi:MAG: hypothetical protein ACTSXQ_01780 [Alphaproteobacteria bacterium]